MPDDAIPMTDRDIEPAPSTTALQPAEPVNDAHEGPTTSAGDAKEKAVAIGQQASDQIRRFADDGKAKASGALDQLAQLLTDAAGNVDDKIGSQYGAYARQAASSVSGFAQRLEARDVDDIVADARAFVRASPAAAIGIAAGLGFIVARAVQSGIDERG